MKFKNLLFFVFVGLLWACEKDNASPIEDERIIIDGEVFTPTESSIKVLGKQLLITFTDGLKEVKIVTNDTLKGAYNILDEPLKPSTLLKATVEYTNGVDTYKGLSGTIILQKDGAVYSGEYDVELKSETDNLEIKINGGTFSNLESTVVDPLIANEAAINDSLDACYPKFDKFIQFEFLFDAVYSNQIALPDSSWSSIYEHTQNPSDEKIIKLWDDAWEIIYKMNLIILSADKNVSNELSKNELIAQAKTIRAYTAFKILEWFNSIPIVEELEGNLFSARNTNEEVVQWIINDVNAAMPNLPETWPSLEDKVTKTFAQGILSRINLYSENYLEAHTVNQEIINGGAYALSTATNFQKDNTEIFWGFAKGDYTEFNTFFTKGDFVPVIRYTETILSSAETAYYTTGQGAALNYINMLKQRSGETELVNVDLDIIYEQYKTELSLEGDIFLIMKRFSKAEDELQIQNYQFVLPIPLTVLDNNPDISQNPGY
ncbi:RagB/SusD family nutrient uptake outer membrane protein [Flavivirga eckloniae]|uniref:RagB/SusD family nutrient uptake outer membrane protein n=1 Tax=Flavivirga eckloniae TaxID=1803846 RepID=A0A2K9PNV8_9FLAO|nr:RagB/SusD family nutrient uptake outer membrane protein [Flavivirga eckloniae]AUP78753.1 hypothetical protein C1H87_08590 [Flavivirga eckloniae]